MVERKDKDLIPSPEKPSVSSGRPDIVSSLKNPIPALFLWVIHVIDYLRKNLFSIRRTSMFFPRENINPGSDDCSGKGKLLY